MDVPQELLDTLPANRLAEEAVRLYFATHTLIDLDKAICGPWCPAMGERAFSTGRIEKRCRTLNTAAPTGQPCPILQKRQP